MLGWLRILPQRLELLVRRLLAALLPHPAPAAEAAAIAAPRRVRAELRHRYPDAPEIWLDLVARQMAERASPRIPTAATLPIEPPLPAEPAISGVANAVAAARPPRPRWREHIAPARAATQPGPTSPPAAAARPAARCPSLTVVDRPPAKASWTELDLPQPLEAFSAEPPARADMPPPASPKGQAFVIRQPIAPLPVAWTDEPKPRSAARPVLVRPATPPRPTASFVEAAPASDVIAAPWSDDAPADPQHATAPWAGEMPAAPARHHWRDAPATELWPALRIVVPTVAVPDTRLAERLARLARIQARR